MNIIRQLKQMRVHDSVIVEAEKCTTEREYWHACSNPGVLIWWAWKAGVEVKRLMLVACRCIREIPVAGRGTLADNLPEESRAALAVIERDCRGEATTDECDEACIVALRAAWRSSTGSAPDIVKADAATAVFLLSTGDIQKGVHTAWYAASSDEGAEPDHVRRCAAEVVRGEVAWEEIERLSTGSHMRNDRQTAECE